MESRMKQGLQVFLCAALVLPALADQPLATFDSFNDWIGAEARGVRIGADGRLRLAPNLRRVAQLPEGVIWTTVSDGEGGAFISAGNEGRLFRFSKGQVKPLAQVKGGIVFAMAKLGKDLIVAPSGERKLFRVTPEGDVKPFADIDARLVWAMSAQGAEVVVAGGTEKSAVLLLAREGTSRRLAELPGETSFSALLADPQGGWYLGSHGHGLVLRCAGERLETLAATGFEQVHALAVQDGAVYVAANNGLADRFTAGNLETRENYLAEPGSKTKSAVIRLDRNRVPSTLWQSNQSQVFALAAWGGQILVGTGNRARIFGIPLDEQKRSLDPFAAVQDLGTAQATAFLAAGPDLMAVGSNPAELHLLSEAQATEGTLESRVLKGAPVADWGRAYVEAETPQGTSVSLQYRAGSTEIPDGTWSPWSPPLRNGERPSLQPTRFAQFRLKLASSRGGTTPVVDSARVHWANRNLPPQWENIEIMPPGLVITRNTPAADMGIERVPLDVQKLIPALGQAGTEKRGFRRGAQAFVFRVGDPNEDQLQFRIDLLPEKGNPIPLERTWQDAFFTFDTLMVPDGRYRLEVTASDAPSEPFNFVQTSRWRTPAFTVDHTPPAILEAAAVPEGESLRVRFLARDEASTLSAACVSADGDEWLQVAPEDRVFDGTEERFEVLIPKDRIRGDRVTVRVTDLCGNEQTVSIPVGAAKKR